MCEVIVLFIIIVMAMPSTTINVNTKWFKYEYSGKRFYDFHKKLFRINK